MKLNKLPLARRMGSSKQNQQTKTQPKLEKKIDESIDEWKQITDRAILKQTTNQTQNKKYTFPTRSRLSTVQSLNNNQDNNKRKFSQIEILKKEAIFLDKQIFDERKATTEYMKTQPTQKRQILPIKLDNWLKTNNNGFFRSQERHSIVQKKRSKIKQLRKVDIMKLNMLTQSNTKIFKQSLLRQIQDINRPIVLYPLMDTIYHQQIKQRLNAPSLKSKRCQKRQKNNSVCKQQQHPIPCERNIKTTNSWRSSSKLLRNKMQCPFMSKFSTNS